MRAKKINSVIWIVISIILLILTIMHPRINMGLVFFVCISQCLTFAFSKKKRSNGAFWGETFMGIAAMVIVLVMFQPLNIFYPYHAVYEYKNDIYNFKIERPQKYSHFPDNIPKTASNVKWLCMPGFMQGSSYEALFFYADEPYIEESYNKYAEVATIYTYDGYDWINKEGKNLIFFPKVNDISEEERRNVSVLVITDNHDVDNLQISGLYLNQEAGYVCYFKY